MQKLGQPSSSAYFKFWLHDDSLTSENHEVR